MRRASGVAVVTALMAMLFVPIRSAAQVPTSPPGAPTGVTATPGTLSATVQWTSSGSAADSFTVTSNPGGITTTVDGTATSATVTGLGYLLRYTFTVTGTNSLGTGPASAPSESITPGPPGGPYHQGDGRVLANDYVSAGQPLRFNSGADRVHAPGLSAVVLNITASQASTATDVQVVQTNEVEQTISVRPGEVQSSLVVVPAPAELTHAAVQVTAGTAHVQIDFVGYFTDPRTLRDHSGLLTMVAPAPLLDATVQAGSTTDVAVLGQVGVPSAHVGEVLLNVSATAAAGTGAITVLPTGSSVTGSTTLGFAAGETTTNRAIVAVPSSGSISVIDSYAAATIHVDVLGWFSDGTDTAAVGGLYNLLPSARLVDTSAAGGPVAAGATLTIPIYGRGGAPPVTATAPPTTAIVNITAVGPTGAGSLSAAGTTVLDFIAGETASRVALVHLASDGSITVGVQGVATNVTVDLIAYFAGDLIVPGSTKVMTPDILASITKLSDGADSVTFRPGTQVSPFIRLNDVIVAGSSPTTPQGFLLRVLSINAQPDGSVVLGTRQAALSEALTAFTFDGVIVPSFTRFGMRSNHAGSNAPQTTVAITVNPCPGPPPNSSIDPNCPDLSMRTLVLLANSVSPGTFPLPGSDGAVHLTPVPWVDLALTDLDLQVLPHFHIEYNFSNNTAKAFFAFSIGFKMALELSVTKDLINRTLDLPSVTITPAPDAHFTFFIGPVPVVITPTITVAVTMDASISVGMRFGYHFDKWSQISESFDGSAFHASNVDKTYVNGFDQPGFEGDTQAKVAYHVGPGLSFYQFCVPVPIINKICINPFTVGVDLNRFLKAHATVTCTPQPSCFPNPWWTLSTGLCIGVFMKVSLLFVIDKYFQQDLACAEQVLLQAPGPHLNVIITPSSATVPRFHVQHFHAVVTNSASGVRFSVDGGDAHGTLSNILLTTDVDYTAPGIPGDYRLLAAALDDTSSVGIANIHVPADPPSMPRSVSASVAGATSATVTWVAPADNGGVPITDYKVVSSDGTSVDAGTSTSVIFTGLKPGTAYTFRVFATNQANLISVAAVSNSITTPGATGPMSVVPRSITFGSVTLGQSSQPQTVVVTADGVPMVISTLTLAGANPGEFAIQNDLCTNQTLQPGGSCSFAILYRPTQRITASASVSINDSDPTSPQTVGLTGSSPVPTTPGIEPMADIQMIDRQHGFAVDANGILATADGGATWSRRPIPADAQIVPSGPGLRSDGRVRFVDLTNGWVLGCTVASCNTLVIGTTDGGATWHDVSTLPAGFHGSEMSRSDPLNGWVLGWTQGNTSIGQGILHENALYATTDGGQTWHLQTLPGPAASTCPNEGDFAPGIKFTDNQNGWYVSASRCWAATFPFPQIGSQFFVANTNDGGATWTNHPLPSNVIGITGIRLQVLSPTQIRFKGAFDLIPGVVAPILLSSDDGGATFSESNFSFVSNGFVLHFDSPDIRFFDATHAIAVGSTLPAVYRTSDGGQSWVQVAVLPDFTDPTGTLEDVAARLLEFTDTNNIWMAGVALYPNSSAGVIEKSSDGGVTWTVQLLGDGT